MVACGGRTEGHACAFLLWDIDHTLITTDGLGRELSAIAFEQVTGRPMTTQATVDGITEPVIFRETAKLHGLSTDRGDFERFAEALTAVHVEHAAELRERGHAMLGAAVALDALARQDGVTQTVLTGNVRGVAEVKLHTFDLGRHIRWEIGAYGDDAEDAVIIGDTPADVESGHRTGTRVIAVATGRSTEADHDLVSTGPSTDLPSAR